MADLNKGVRLPADVDITLNNRLFESPKGTLLFTFRPDQPSAAITGDRLLLGSDVGYVKVFLVHDVTGDGYRVKVTSNGTGGPPVTSPTALIDYEEEVTIGVVYDSVAGDLKLLVNKSDNQVPADNGTNNAAFFTSAPNGVSIGSPDTKDPALSIGLQDFTGFVGRLATYSVATDDNALVGYVADPNSWPTASRLQYLDGANLASASKVDTSQPSEQMLSFGYASNSGTISLGPLNIYVNRGDSGDIVAQKVGKVLSEAPGFRSQLEKQVINFEHTSGSGSQTIKVAGVSVTGTDAATLATSAKTALEASSFIQGTYRTITNNGDGSITITFTEEDGNADPVSIVSAAGATATVETTQTYSATGQGRSVTVNDNTVTVRFNVADGDLSLWASASGNPAGPKFSAGATGVSITASEIKAYIPSEFQFVQTPVPQIQRIALTKDPNADGNITFGTAGTTLLTVGLTSADTVLTAVDDIVAASAAATGSLLAGLDDIIDDGDSVLIKFNTSAGAFDLLRVDGSAAGTNAVVLLDQQYAENTRGESQTLAFKTPTTGRADGTITVDGVSVAVTATESANSIAKKVEAALEDNARYSTPEVQTVFIRQGTDSDGGAFSLAGQNFATASAVLTTDGVAEMIAREFNTAGTNVFSVEADGSAVHFTMTNAHGKSTALLGAFADNTGASASGVLTTPMQISQEYNSEGVRKTIVNGDQLTVEFGAHENNMGGITFNSSASANISASVLQDFEHHTVDLTASSYTGSVAPQNPTGSGIKPSNILYTELVSVGSAVGGLRPVKFNVFVDPGYSNELQGGYESVGFTMNYQTSDFGTTAPTISMAGGQNSINAQPSIGQVAFSWLNSNSVVDFSKPLASVTLQQASQNVNTDFTFSNVNIDGIDYTDAPTLEDPNTRYSQSFADSLQTDRWEVSSTLVSALDSTTGIGGQLIGYYANPSVAGAQLRLQFQSLTDLDDSQPSFDTQTKVITFDVISVASSASSAKFTVELPSNVIDASFHPASGTGEGVAVGRSLEVALTGANVVRGATLGQVQVTLDDALSKTHEFSITPGSASVNGANISTTQSLYAGYTKTMVSPTASLKGDWTASDIPKGEFNTFAVGTADPQASTVITTADALQILKLSTGLPLDWKPSVQPPVGAYVAADLDGSGKINAADALMALRYATGTFDGQDPVHWEFIDGNTELATPALGVTNALPKPLKTGMQVTGDTVIQGDNTTPTGPFQIEAVLVGNLTNPISDPF